MDRPPCVYGSSCYRKNPLHFLEFSHPESVSISRHEEAIAVTPTTLTLQASTVSVEQASTISEEEQTRQSMEETPRIKLHSEEEYVDSTVRLQSTSAEGEPAQKTIAMDELMMHRSEVVTFQGNVPAMQETTTVTVQASTLVDEAKLVTETVAVRETEVVEVQEDELLAMKEVEVITTQEELATTQGLNKKKKNKKKSTYVGHAEVMTVCDPTYTDVLSNNEDLPPLASLLRQLSLSASSGLIGSEEKAIIKDLLLSGDRGLVLSAATILDTLTPPVALPKQPKQPEAKTGLVMYLLRGISGSGKSTLSAKLTTQDDGSRVGLVCSTDDFFMTAKGVYQFDGARLNEAHTWNQQRVRSALAQRINPVVVDNTHTQRWEAQPYVQLALEFGYEVHVREPTTWWARDAHELAKRNTHGVPLEAIQRMLDRWETDFSVEAILASRSPTRRKPQGGDANNRKKYERSENEKFGNSNKAPDMKTRIDRDFGDPDDNWQQVTRKSFGRR